MSPTWWPLFQRERLGSNNIAECTETVVSGSHNDRSSRRELCYNQYTLNTSVTAAHVSHIRKKTREKCCKTEAGSRFGLVWLGWLCPAWATYVTVICLLGLSPPPVDGAIVNTNQWLKLRRDWVGRWADRGNRRGLRSVCVCVCVCVRACVRACVRVYRRM